ncbi:MAG: hypothetical protein ACLR5S_06435 [Ruminococcus sp.]
MLNGFAAAWLLYQEILERETGLPVLGCLPQLSEVQRKAVTLG